jgi:hypothetical protein
MLKVALSLSGFLLAVFLTSSALAANLAEFNNGAATYHETMKKAQADFRKALASSLAEATKVEIFLLDFDPKDYPDATHFDWDLYTEKDSFPIMPYNSVSRILARKTLTSEQIKTLLPALQMTVSVQKDEGGAACHFPIHGIRVWVGNNLLFQTSFCWHCGNFFVKYPDETSRWLNIEEPKLQKIFNDLMPIPTAELERFKKVHEGIPVDLRGG